jgi:hypothetical protein
MQPSTNCILIQGITTAGRTFRPSDWAERLCGVLGSFDADERLRYAEDVQPILLDGVRCVAVSTRLTTSNPAGFKFLVDFARDNDLRILQPVGTAQTVPAKRVLLTA